MGGESIKGYQLKKKKKLEEDNLRIQGAHINLIIQIYDSAHGPYFPHDIIS